MCIRDRLRRLPLQVFHTLLGDEAAQHPVLSDAQPLVEPAAHRDEILGPLEDHPHLFEPFIAQRPHPPGRHNPLRASDPDPRHPQQLLSLIHIWMACESGCIGGAACLTHGPKDKSEVDKYSREALEKTIKDAIGVLQLSDS